MWNMHDVGWGWWVVSSIGMVAFWALVIYGVFWLTRSAGGQTPRREPPEPPEEVLKRRLAAGEISVEEYEQARQAMAGEAPAQPRESALH